MFIKQQSHKNEFKIGKTQEEEAIEVSKEHEINTDHLTYKTRLEVTQWFINMTGHANVNGKRNTKSILKLREMKEK